MQENSSFHQRKKTKIKINCNSTIVKTSFIINQTLLELEPDCMAHIGKFKLRTHTTFHLTKSKIETIDLALKNLNFDGINFERSNNSAEEPTLLAESAEMDEIFSSLNQLEHRQKSLKKLDKLQEKDNIHTYSLLGLGLITLTVTIIFIFVIYRTICPAARSIAIVTERVNQLR